jgi:hypothetical protein
VDEMLIGGPEKGKRALIRETRSLGGDKIGRAYCEVIEEASGENFKPFFERHIDNDNGQVLTDGRPGYWPLESEFEIRQRPSKGGKNYLDYMR